MSKSDKISYIIISSVITFLVTALVIYIIENYKYQELYKDYYAIKEELTNLKETEEEQTESSNANLDERLDKLEADIADALYYSEQSYFKLYPEEKNKKQVEIKLDD